ncbi:MAG: type IV pili twitching motility protein PilT [Caldiserica bacterium]|nr:MAG: type IV pili twitching motility protein PilT [Caldisericota bacterium]
MIDIFEVLKTAVEKNASDIHIVPQKPVMVRIYGKVIPLSGFEDKVLSSEETQQLIYGILHPDQRKKFEENLELDTSLQVKDISRFRVNVLMQKNGIGAVLRVIPSKIPEPEDLGFTPAMIELTKLPRGLVLVTGPTGSGKSTTLACMLELINKEREEHILTIEDPIEFVYESKKCIITQREVGMHTRSFANALRAALREDPDIVLIGEMRDLETIQSALTIAETGHLVFATLHTTDAPQTIDRIIDVFPPYQQQQIRMQLSVVLRGVICQQLLPRMDGKGRVAAREIMIVTPAVSNLIREGKTHQLYSAIETGSKFGMISLDRSLAELVKKGLISKDIALMKANNPENLKRLLGAGPGFMPAGRSFK